MVDSGYENLQQFFNKMLRNLKICPTRKHCQFPDYKLPQTQNAGLTYTHTEICGAFATGNAENIADMRRGCNLQIYFFGRHL